MRFQWRDIPRTPDEPGIYGWYYVPEITTADLESTVQRVLEANDDGKHEEAREVVHLFLSHALFRYFQEDPYTAKLHGPLKPTFIGQLEHHLALSDTLIRRIAEHPDRLRHIKEVVEQSAPAFSSPLYIGMASNLRTRLMRHKRMIEASDLPLAFNTEAGSEDTDHLTRDRTFAERVRSRRIPPTRLFAMTQVIANAEDSCVDVENILNRLYFPLLGRN